MTLGVPAIETFYGLIRFDESIDCTKDTLGSKADVVIGGVAGILELPSPAPGARQDSCRLAHAADG